MFRTIADITARKSHAMSLAEEGSRQYWDTFLDGRLYHMDTPILAAKEFLWKYVYLYDGEIVYLSGRREGTESHSRRWLKKHNFPLGKIYHRPQGYSSLLFKSYWLQWLMGNYRSRQRRRRGSSAPQVRVDAHIGDRLEDDKAAADEAGVRFILVSASEWPAIEDVF